MSGGYFSYYDTQLKSEIFGSYGDKPPRNVFEDKEITELVWDVLELIHSFDYYQQGDSSEEDYLKAKKNFKDKWLKNDPERCKYIIDEAIAETKDELYKTFGI